MAISSCLPRLRPIPRLRNADDVRWLDEGDRAESVQLSSASAKLAPALTALPSVGDELMMDCDGLNIGVDDVGLSGREEEEVRLSPILFGMAASLKAISILLCLGMSLVLMLESVGGCDSGWEPWDESQLSALAMPVTKGE